MDRIKYSTKEQCIIDIECSKNIEVVIRTAISKYVEKNFLRVVSLDRHEKNESVKLKITIITSRIQRIDDLVKNISSEPEVSHISWEHNKDFLYDNLDSLEED